MQIADYQFSVGHQPSLITLRFNPDVARGPPIEEKAEETSSPPLPLAFRKSAMPQAYLFSSTSTYSASITLSSPPPLDDDAPAADA